MTDEVRYVIFSPVLRRVFRRKRMGAFKLSKALDLSPTTCYHWFAGRTLPTGSSLDKILSLVGNAAENELLEAHAKEREHTCPCGRTFWQTSKSKDMIWCSKTCRARGHKAKLAVREYRLVRMNAIQNELDRHRKGISEFCHGCTTTGYCPDAMCAIQVNGLSPFQPQSKEEQREPRRVATSGAARASR